MSPSFICSDRLFPNPPRWPVRTLLASPFTFDPCIIELFATFAAGGAVYLAQNGDVVRFLVESPLSNELTVLMVSN